MSINKQNVYLTCITTNIGNQCFIYRMEKVIILVLNSLWMLEGNFHRVVKNFSKNIQEVINKGMKSVNSHLISLEDMD